MNTYKLYNLIDLLYYIESDINIEMNVVTKFHTLFWVMFDEYDFYIHKTKQDIDNDSYYHDAYYYTIVSNDNKNLNNQINNIYDKLSKK